MYSVAILIFAVILVSFQIVFTKEDDTVRSGDGDIRILKCDNKNIWFRVDSKGINIARKENRSVANNVNCVSIIPAIPNVSFIVLNVYANVFNEDSGFEVLVYDDFKCGSPVLKHEYKGAFVKTGWNRYTSPIYQDPVTCIHLLGFTRDGEMISINSITILPMTTNKYREVSTNKVERILNSHEYSLNDVNNNTDTINRAERNTNLQGLDALKNNNDDIFNNDNCTAVTDGIFRNNTTTSSTHTVEAKDILIRQINSDSNFVLYIIIAASLTLIILIIILGIVAFSFGKRKGKKDVGFKLEDIEPPLSINIPRVKGLYSFDSVSTLNI